MIIQDSIKKQDDDKTAICQIDLDRSIRCTWNKKGTRIYIYNGTFETKLALTPEATEALLALLQTAVDGHAG